MPRQLDLANPRYAAAAAEILRRYEDYEAEANITSAVREFLTGTGLAKSEEIVEENPPAHGSRQAVDLTALNTFVEVKRRIGSSRGFEPNPQYVEQLDDYLAQSQAEGKGVRLGILTDGKRWLLRWPGAGPVNPLPPYGFTLQSDKHWFLIYQWLRDEALVADVNIKPEREVIEKHFGPNSPLYERDIAALSHLYASSADQETIEVKRRLWRDLLVAALGEVAESTADLNDLFVRHTYLSIVIGMVVQASFGLDIRQLARNNPDDLLLGRRFSSDTGLSGIVESDFFAWPVEVGGQPLITAVADRVARFGWLDAPADIAAILYESVIPPAERRQLGEYYTPHWLARAMVREVVTDPLDQHVLDPACGSGTFVAEAVLHFIDAAERADLEPRQALDRLRASVTGMDVHPVAVHLARAAWVLAARPAIQATVDAGESAAVSAPIYLGDALQMRFRNGDMFAEHEVTLRVEGRRQSELIFPVRLVEQADAFDRLMGAIADQLERGQDPLVVLDDHGITDASERRTLRATLATMQNLRGEGRDHIWAYYARNLVRPVALARGKVDVIVGNPPWLNYNKTASTLRRALEDQSKNLYGIWAGGRYATHQDVAGLFFTRCADLYLKDDGLIGMVMPHSALQTGQYSKWRTGVWSSEFSAVEVDFGWKPAWDLERLDPNTFFPVPASVVFAARVQPGGGAPLQGEVERWLGRTGSDNVRRVPTPITDTSLVGSSAYNEHTKLGALLYPRCLLFVHETENPAIIKAGQTVTVNPHRGPHDKEPWRSLDLTIITQQTIEKSHLFDVHLGETIVPYATLDPLTAVLPMKYTDSSIPKDDDGVGGVRLAGLEQRMRDRWRIVSRLWEENKSPVTKLNLLGRLDYWGPLSAQLAWRQDPGNRPVRIVYTKSGIPTASILDDRHAVIDHKLFWVTCKSAREAYYLLAIINSTLLSKAVEPLMPKGQFGARDLQKHLWKLPIPEFDPDNSLHRAIAAAGEAAAVGVARELADLREQRPRVTVTIARRELRRWLLASTEGQAVEAAVARLLT